jgi:hypothetical protein
MFRRLQERTPYDEARYQHALKQPGVRCCPQL